MQGAEWTGERALLQHCGFLQGDSSPDGSREGGEGTGQAATLIGKARRGPQSLELGWGPWVAWGASAVDVFFGRKRTILIPCPHS